jgi:regulatory protein
MRSLFIIKILVLSGTPGADSGVRESFSVSALTRLLNLSLQFIRNSFRHVASSGYFRLSFLLISLPKTGRTRNFLPDLKLLATLSLQMENAFSGRWHFALKTCYSMGMRITALEQQAHNPNRVNLYADGAFLMGISAELMLKLSLHLDQELSSTDVEQLKQAENLQQAIERAINYLSFRPRSQEEVRRHLQKKETPPEIIDEALAYLKERDYVNDLTFATFWVESREQFNPRGSQALRNELRQKGVDREIVAEIVTNEQDEELALRAGRKKALLLLQRPGMDYKTFRNRLGGFLQRRGFSYEAVSRAVRTLWEEQQDTSPDEE